MQLHELKGNQYKRSAKRIGRGGKRGSYSGRGVKGQKSRAGRRIRPAERDLILKFPKRRGFRNKPKSEKSKVFNLSDFARLKIATNAGKQLVLDKDFLRRVRFLSPNFKGEVKILGNGEIRMPMEIRGLKVSGGARKKIEKAGGKIIQ